MKEIKAYIRKSSAKTTVNALQEAKAPGVTVVEVHPVGYGYEPNCFEPGFEDDVLKRYKYLEIVKLEVVCADTDLEKLLEVIQRECCTGQRGDGMIFVTDVRDAVRIHTGVRGEQSLFATCCGYPSRKKVDGVI